jgi:metal-responsive CopG/Arc/MetJ family transcriptional regulator
MILPQDLLIKVDTLAGGKNKRSVFIEQAIRAYIISEEKKLLKAETATATATAKAVVKK